jgi:hypothetical protein
MRLVNRGALDSCTKLLENLPGCDEPKTPDAADAATKGKELRER